MYRGSQRRCSVSRGCRSPTSLISSATALQWGRGTGSLRQNGGALQWGRDLTVADRARPRADRRTVSNRGDQGSTPTAVQLATPITHPAPMPTRIPMPTFRFFFLDHTNAETIPKINE